MHLPSFLFLEVNQQCNLRCQHCFYWTRDEVAEPGHISVARRAEIIKEFHEVSPRGTLVICGGESTMNPERFWPITLQARELGLKCFCVMNGTSVVDDAEAERLLRDGPTEITISMNSHREDVHNGSRGPGSYQAAVDAIRRLLAARDRLDAVTPIYVMAVICELNYRELDAFYNFVLNELKADKLKLNFLQPSFGSGKVINKDKFFASKLVKDVPGLMAIIDACETKYQLGLNPEWKRVVELYHASIHRNGDAERGWMAKGTDEPICNSYERNIMLDMYGTARLCFSHNFPGTKLAQPGDLRKFWFENAALKAKMAACTACCGISHSVRRASATKR